MEAVGTVPPADLTPGVGETAGRSTSAHALWSQPFSAWFSYPAGTCGAATSTGGSLSPDDNRDPFGAAPPVGGSPSVLFGNQGSLGVGAGASSRRRWPVDIAAATASTQRSVGPPRGQSRQVRVWTVWPGGWSHTPR